MLVARCRNSERGENCICAGECFLKGPAIVKRLDDSNPRSGRHGGYAFRPRTNDGGETHSFCSAHVEYSPTETTCSADNGYMLR
jgi:hypothetical protein